MGECLIALDKQTGVQPVGVVDTWRRLVVKCVLCVAGQDAQAVCRTEQLVGELEAGIEGGIHVMHLLWAQNYQE